MMQDLVAPGCGPDGNAVQGFVRSFAQEKSEFQQVRQTIGCFGQRTHARRMRCARGTVSRTICTLRSSNMRTTSTRPPARASIRSSTLTCVSLCTYGSLLALP